jgi:hypothetical protein
MVNKYPERNHEPSMFQILSGGFEAPVEGDYKKDTFKRGDLPIAKKNLDNVQLASPKQGTKAKPLTLEDIVKKDLIHRINKSESQYVSETQDNFRKYAYDGAMKQFLYDYLQNQERNNGKPPTEIEDWMLTVYQRDYLERMRKAGKLEQIRQEDFEREDNQEKNRGKTAKDQKLIKTKSSERDQNRNTPNNNERGRPQSAHPLKSKNAKGKDSKYSGLKKPSTRWDKEKVLQKSSEFNRKHRIDELHKWARWLPDSAYQSYFGKPAFHAYGKNNTKPTAGGVVYGQYMLSHNVNPEHGQNNPKYQQVYKSAMNYGFRKGDRVPVLSRKGHENLEITESQLEEMRKRNPIMPPKFKNPDPEDMYTDGSDGEYDFSHIKNKSEKLDFHPKKGDRNADGKTKKISDEHQDDKENEEEQPEAEEVEDTRDGKNRKLERVNYTDGSTPLPEPGTLEYKRMLEQFMNNPENARMALAEGGDLQNMFPFCSVHNSYGQQLPLHELDPRNYKFLPAKYVNRIAPAGKLTAKSDKLYKVILPEEY